MRLTGSRVEGYWFRVLPFYKCSECINPYSNSLCCKGHLQSTSSFRDQAAAFFRSVTFLWVEGLGFRV